MSTSVKRARVLGMHVLERKPLVGFSFIVHLVQPCLLSPIYCEGLREVQKDISFFQIINSLQSNKVCSQEKEQECKGLIDSLM